MSTSRFITALPLVAFTSLVAPTSAHAGRFPLFIVISDNPWLIAIGIGLVVTWLVVRALGDS